MRRLPDSYRGKRVLLAGATGFLGGVTLSRLFYECPDIARVYVLLRRAPGLPAPQRFTERVLTSVAFDPVRARWADLGPKVRVLQGDLAQPDLGLDEAARAELGDLDLILNCAGLVDFEAPLDQAYRTNILGVRHLADVARHANAHLVHVSTCFVAGSAAGTRPETAERGFFPRQQGAPYLVFDPDREVADIEESIARLARSVEEQSAQARHREQALERFRNLNAGLPSPAALANAARRIQRDDLRDRLQEAGRQRAEFWGWPNVYTYSKSIGEQILLGAGVRHSIVRPAIIESALAYPEPGYNLNATTTAPLVMLALNGFGLAPARADLVLDIVPVDAVARGILAVGAAAVEGRAAPVYQIGTSDTNPLRLDRLFDLMGLYLHERELAKNPSKLEGVWKANREPAVIGRGSFEADTGRIERLWRTLASTSRDWRERVDNPRLRDLLARLADRAGRTADDLDKARSLWELFLPFSHDLDYRFTGRHIRALWKELGEEVPAADLDWRTYWLDVHIPGLRKHVLTDSFGKPVKPVATPTSLGERVEAVARSDGFAAAITRLDAGRPATLTYGELWARARTIAGALRAYEPDEVAIGLDRDAHWMAGLLGAGLAGKVAHLVRRGASLAGRDAGATRRDAGATRLRLLPAGDGCELIHGRRKSSVSYPQGRPDLPALGPAETVNPPAVRCDGGPAIPARDLAARLEALAGYLEAGGRGPIVADADSEPLALLAVLHAQAELWLVPGAALAEAVTASGATAAIAGADVPDGAGRLRAVLDLAPLAGMARLEPIVEKRLAVTQVLISGLTLAAHRTVRQQADRDEPFAAERDADWDDLPWAIRQGEDGSREVFLDGLRAPGAGLASVEARLADAPAVAAARVVGDESSRLAFVQASFAGLCDFRGLLAALSRLLHDVNAAVPASQRLHAMIVTLGPMPEAGSDWESRTDWIRLAARADRPDWARFADDRIPLEDLEDEAIRLARGRMAGPALDFVLAHHREAPRTYDRLLLLERVLAATFATGAPFNAQVFLGRYEQEAARTRTPVYRLGYRLGALARRWRDWHESEDPDGLLLPGALTEPVKQGLGRAIGAFFTHAMDVSVRGAAYIPAQGSFVVVANHSSHLDTGVIKFALGPWGDRIRALAAKDYFFGTPARRFVAHHFTRLIPTERQAVTTEWIKRTRDALAQGDCALIFPEGTRTSDPAVGAFKASLGTLLRSCRAPVLPIYIYGTHAILPKGRAIPKGRDIRVHIGPVIPYERLERAAAAAGGTLGRDRLIADYVRDAVAALESGDFFWLREEAR